MRDPVIETMPLGFQWPMRDPFLFGAHHLDHYPAANDHLGPNAPLAGRDLGQDFAGIDGWRMYHGQVVPGFPQHPHRGFETVTYARQGLIDHADSLGAAARFGRGDVQWLTAGAGIVHAEMFPLLDRERPNPVELFQIWLNLPPEDKMVEPHFSMFWDDRIPRLIITDADGRTTEVTVIAGAIPGATPPPPPPRSWASRPESDVAIWHVRLDEGAQWVLPHARTAETVRTVYGFEGTSWKLGDHELGGSTGAVVRTDEPVTLTAGSATECLVLRGRPIGEPVAQSGPFVMNHEDELLATFADYRRTGFGGWPWPVDGPTHGTDERRFARHADGRIEELAQARP